MESPPEPSGKEVFPSRRPLHEDNARSFCVRELAAVDDESTDRFAGQDCVGEIRELYWYLDMVKRMVRPGCPPEVLDVALDSVSLLFKCLTTMSSSWKPHASL